MTKTTSLARQGLPLNQTAPYVEFLPNEPPTQAGDFTEHEQIDLHLGTGISDTLSHQGPQNRVTVHVPLERIQTKLLARDPDTARQPDVENLMQSLKDLGLSNPIVVCPAADGDGYELVQGYLRFTAFKALRDHTGDDIWTSIPATVLPPDTDFGDLYRSMIDENLVRRGLSYAEMAQAAITFAADAFTPEDNLHDAINMLFQSASPSKRSHIRAFSRLIDYLGEALLHPNAIPRDLGIAVDRKITTDPELAPMIYAELVHSKNRSKADELAILRRYVGEMSSSTPKSVTLPTGPNATESTVKTENGTAIYCAAKGTLSVSLDRDFRDCDPRLIDALLKELIDNAF